MQHFGKPIVEEQFLGYNDRLPPQFLAPGEFVNLTNVRVSDGKIRKVTGTSSVANQIADKPAVGLAVLENFASGDKWIVAALNGASNATWYSWAGSGSFALISGSNVFANNIPQFYEVAVNKLYGFDGSNVGSWDGASFVHNPGSIPKGLYPVWFHNYLFVANTTSFPNRIYWSGLGDPSNFAGGISTFTIGSAGGGYAVGDVVTVSPQASGSGVNGTFVVTTVSTGAVTGLSLLTEGSGYAVANGYATSDDNGTGTATGAGLTINITAVDTSTLSNFIDINPGDGDEITGLGVLNDQLFVFKKNTIWSISGFSGASFTVATANAENTNNRIQGYGCIAPGSIVATGDDIYFLSFVGDTPHIRSLVKTQYATTIEGGVITYDISGTMGGLSMPALSTIQGIYDGRYIKWALPGNGASLPDFLVELDTYGIAKSHGRTIYPFVQRQGIHPQFFILSTISGSADVYFIDWLATSPYQQGVVYKFNSGIYTDLNVQNQIAAEIMTRAYMPDPARKQKWKYLYLKYDTGEISTFDVNSIVDQGDAQNQAAIDLNTGDGDRLDSFVLDASTLGGTAGSVASTRINLAQMVGKMAQFNYFESSNAPFGMYDWEIYTQPKGLRAS